MLSSLAFNRLNSLWPVPAARHALTAVVIALVHTSALAQGFVEPRPVSLYGTPGMIDMPSARFMADGTLAITAETKDPDDRITVAFQALPWLEGTARYSIVYGYPAAPGQNNLFDRSLGLKIRLWKESRWLPQVAAGILDIGGTQVFGGEYVVANKKWGPVDAAVGIGWGRLGSRAQFTNPLVFLKDSFRVRPPASSTGTLATKQLFHGEDVAAFGGVVIDTPIRGFQLIAEYSGDAYVREEQRGIAKVLSPVNFGAAYRPVHGIELGVGFLQNHMLSARITLMQNLKNPRPTSKLDPPAPDIHVRSDAEMRRGLNELLNPGSGGGSGSPRAAFVNAGDLENAPDLTAYPISYGSAPREAAAQRIAESIDKDLSAIRYHTTALRVEGDALILDIAPTATRPPLDCSELWPAIYGTAIAGFGSITFRDPTVEAEFRCTKFLSAGGALSAQTGAPAPTGLTAAASVQSAPTDAPAAPPPAEGEAPSPAWWNDKALTNKLANSVATVLRLQGVPMEAVKLTPREAAIYFTNETYPSAGRALGRVARAMTQVLPPSIEYITLVMTNGTVNGVEMVIPRTALERAAKSAGSPEEILTASTVGPAEPGLPAGSFKPEGRYPAIHPIFTPAYRQSLFDPDDPLRYQVYWRAGADIEFWRGMRLSGSYAFDIFNTFKSITRASDSQLPHVRSDIARYLKEGASGLERLEAVEMFQLAPEIYARLSAGYLEEMYAGGDAEILYRPFGRRWALGGEFAYVRQRNFDRKFGFLPYETATGHVSFYYQSPFYGYEFNVHAGRYLARDWGATFEIARHFDNGAEVKVFATFTDVPFDKFGEGSFDKGIVIRIPLNLASFFSTRQVASVNLSPLTRDGGARLNVSHRLYEETRGIAYDDIQRTFGDFLAPR